VTTGGLAVPPGRAGRLWLERRLAVARRGTDLLDRKLRILAAELAKLEAAAAGTGREWEQRSGEAERALLHATLLGGQRSVRLAAGRELAEVTVSYTVTMGARHPDGTDCTVPRPATWDGPALAAARQAHADALAAAVRHAAAAAAVSVIAAETAATRYRLRAVRDRWIPRLAEALAQVEFSLGEQERADGARLRQALRQNRTR
jgi:V/A-type H+-transporting ATPase subunit D